MSRTLLVLAIAAGVLWRVGRWAAAFPVWGDEAMVLVNYLDHGYLDFFGPVRHAQIAPLFFHWLQLAAIDAFGPSEWAVRAAPLFASLLALWAFARCANLLPPLSPPGGRGVGGEGGGSAAVPLLAVAILAVSIWPATMAALAKPYTLDLLAATLLLWPFLVWARRPDATGPIWVLTGLAVILLPASYPAVFVAGGVGLVLLAESVRTRALRLPTLVYGVVSLAVFVAHYHFVGRAHLAAPAADGVDTAAFMADYWHGGFPPGDPWGFAKWLVLSLTGQTAAYPIGSAAGGSVLTTSLVAVGLVAFWRDGARRFVYLAAAVVGLSLLAGVLRKYPFGASCRLAQHLAPLYVLAMARGIVALYERLSQPSQARVSLCVSLALFVVCLGGVARDIIKPYRDRESVWSREIVAAALKTSRGRVVAVDDGRTMPPVLVWDLHAAGVKVVSPDRLPDRAGVWVLQAAEKVAPDLGVELDRPEFAVCAPERDRPAIFAELGRLKAKPRPIVARGGS